MSSLCSKKLVFFFTSANSHNFIFIHICPSTDTLQKPSKSFVEKKDDFTKDFFTFLLSSFRPRDTHKLSENRHPALFFFLLHPKTVPNPLQSSLLLKESFSFTTKYLAPTLVRGVFPGSSALRFFTTSELPIYRLQLPGLRAPSPFPDRPKPW